MQEEQEKFKEIYAGYELSTERYIGSSRSEYLSQSTRVCVVSAFLLRLKRYFTESLSTAAFTCRNKYHLISLRVIRPGGGGGSTSYRWANGDVPLDGVAFSRLD